MAEILGAVASGLAVAEIGLKAGGTVWKLKRLWQQVHEVPETIQDLMRQIEVMDPILSSHENDLDLQSTALLRQRPTYNGAPATQSAAYCREALDDLRRLVEDLDGAVDSEKRSRRTVARIKVVLKKDTIRGFQDRLERAIRLLESTRLSYLTANAAITGATVANMWTTITDMQVQQQLILQQLSNTESSGSKESSSYPAITQHAGTSQEHTLVRRTGAKRYQAISAFLPLIEPSMFGNLMIQMPHADSTGGATYAARIQLPKWLSGKVWDISVTRACLGWQATLSTWNMVPDDSPGMLCAVDGDLNGLIDLFNRGLASPKDYNIYGDTIFQIACDCSHDHIVKHFIDMDVVRSDTTAMNLQLALSLVVGSISLDILQSLLSHAFFLDPIVDAAHDLETLSLEPDDFVHSCSVLYLSVVASRRQDLLEPYLRTCFPLWHDLRPIRKLGIFLLDIVPEPWPADIVRHFLCHDGLIRPIDAQAWIDDGIPLLCVVFIYYLRPAVKAGDVAWDTLLEEAIKATDDMHYTLQISFDGFGISCTHTAFELALVWALMVILDPQWQSWYVDKTTERRGLKEMTTKLQCLMSVLASCGHNLLEFGRREAVIWAEGDTTRIVGDVLYFWTCDNHDWRRVVKGVHYGAEPRDWYFEMGCPYEKYFGDFWNMVENPHLFRLPGAWVDEEWDSD